MIEGDARLGYLIGVRHRKKTDNTSDKFVPTGRQFPDFRNFEAGKVGQVGRYGLYDLDRKADEWTLRGGSDLPTPVPPQTTLADLGPSFSDIPDVTRSHQEISS